MTGWSEEITELHEFFEALFSGRETSLERAESALAADFTIVGPDGHESSRAQTIEMLEAGRDQRTDLDMSTSDHRLLVDTDDVIVAGYIEHHHAPDGDTHRQSTVVFVPDTDAPNGVRWLRVHETWINP